METKKVYGIDDTVWIYGIAPGRASKGTIVKKFTIDHPDFSNQEHYLVAIPTEIDFLLEVRTWETISQDEHGPVGGIRSAVSDLDHTRKRMKQLGIDFVDTGYEDGDPTPEEVNAALEKSHKEARYSPLMIKEATKSKKRYFAKKRKPNQ